MLLISSLQVTICSFACGCMTSYANANLTKVGLLLVHVRHLQQSYDDFQRNTICLKTTTTLPPFTYLVCNLYIDAVHTRDMDVGSELGPPIQTQIMNMDVETTFCQWSHLKGD